MNVTRRTQTECNVKLAQVVEKKGEKDVESKCTARVGKV